MQTTNIITVDSDNIQTGSDSVINCHLGDGIRHRAITVFIKNSQNKFLLTQRSLFKPLWPTYWDAGFSTHQRSNESLANCAERRALEELGIKNLKANDFENIFSYEYHLPWNEVFSEWEINHILIANYDGKINLNHKESSDMQWLSWLELIKLIESKKALVAPWLEIAVGQINKNNQLLTYFN